MSSESPAVHGGVVEKVVPVPRPMLPAVAVLGTWSGGWWSPEETFPVQHYRGGRWLGERSVRGASLAGLGRDAIFHLSLDLDHEIQPGDVLVFGDGTYTRLDVADHGLSLDRPAAVGLPELGLHAVFVPGPPAELYVFHPADTIIPPADRLVIARRRETSWLEPAGASAPHR